MSKGQIIAQERNVARPIVADVWILVVKGVWTAGEERSKHSAGCCPSWSLAMSTLCQKQTLRSASNNAIRPPHCHAAAFNLTLASKPSSRRAFSVERYPLGSAML